MNAATDGAPTEVGRPRSRADGQAKVTGGARYAGDVTAAGLCHAALVTSAVARGRILQIELPASDEVPGVLALLTHENFPRLHDAPVLLQAGGNRRDPKGSAGQQRLPMQDDRVAYPGEPIAVVIAQTWTAARAAAQRVRVTYAPEPARVSFDAELGNAFEPKDVWGEEPTYARGDVDAGLAAADVRVGQVYYTALQHHVTMEPHGAMASWDGGRLTVHQTTTWVGGGRKTLAAWFGLPEADVRVRNEYVGGSFGSKGPTWPHVAICAAAARHVGRPVRLVLTRQDTFTDAGRRPRIRHDVRLGATRDGRLTAFRYDATAETSTFDDRVVAPTTRTPPRLYACANVATSYKLVRLNRSGPFTMRGPGEAPGLFALESAMDELSYALGIDPVELRLRNHADEDPTERQPWSSKHLRECYRQGAERFGWSRRDPRPGAMRDGDEQVGWGMASMIYDARSAKAAATATLSAADGSVVLRSATCDPGTGQYTILPQIAADAAGIPVERVRLELGDTDLPVAPLVAGSQTTATVGTAVSAAAADLRRQLLTLAVAAPGSPLLGRDRDTLEVVDGVVRPTGAGGPSIAAADVPTLAGLRELVGRGESQPIEETKDVSRFSFGAHFAEVRVRPRTGEARVTRYVGAFAAGRIINPKTAHSQLIGGIVWGIGQALMEETHVCPATGHYVNRDLSEYLVPTNPDVPAIDAFFVEERDERVNPLGVKGVGEIGTIGAAPAIANAVYHATGRRVRELPITPDKLL